ncbi:MAG: BRCT domain-containing protein [Peptostreptococcaceae bacterium]
MINMIILDIETGGFDVADGIREVAALVIEDNEIIDTLHIGKVIDPQLTCNGYGEGYEDISLDADCISKFKKFIEPYDYPLVAHNANFDRKFLVYYEWLDSTYPIYDSIRAIRYENPYLFSYAMEYLLNYYDISNTQEHTAIKDTHNLFELILIVNPKTWIPVGKSKTYKREYSKKKISLTIDDSDIVSDLFKDKNIVFTGKGPYVRNELSLLAMKYGATVLNGVNKKTDILVVGEGAGQKLQKAKDLGIEILNIDDFMDMTSNIDMNMNTQQNNSTELPRRSTQLKFNFDEDILCGDIVSLVPMRLKVAEKLTPIIYSLGGNPITSFRQKETKLLIYETYGEDFVTVHKAKDKNIKTLALHEFNKILVEDKIQELICEA